MQVYVDLSAGSTLLLKDYIPGAAGCSCFIVAARHLLHCQMKHKL